MIIKTGPKNTPQSIFVDGVEFVQKNITQPKKHIEYIYVIDNSGSAPLDTYLDLLEKLLKSEILKSQNLSKMCKFNVVPFNKTPIFRNSMNYQYINKDTLKMIREGCINTKGGPSDIYNAIKRAHTLPKDKDFERIMVIITDGIV